VCRGTIARCKELPVFRMSVEGLGSFGNPRRPRTVWIGVGEGSAEVKELQAALEAKMLELGCYRREERAFTPHVTLGRVKQADPEERLAALLQKKADWKGGTVEVREVLVMSSELTSKGPIYTVLSRAPLARNL
jgi:2'-5' RNA ligase